MEMRNVTNEINVAAELDADDVFALRKADTVSFHTFRGENYVRAYLRDHGDRVFTVREQAVFNGHRDDRRDDRYREVRVLGMRCEDYGTDRGDKITGYSYLMHADMSQEWRTIAAAIRPGESLYFRWVRDNNNQVHESLGLHRDEFRLVVGKQGEAKSRAYLVDVQVGPDNTARMVKRA